MYFRLGENRPGSLRSVWKYCRLAPYRISYSIRPCLVATYISPTTNPTGPRVFAYTKSTREETVTRESTLVIYGGRGLCFTPLLRGRPPKLPTSDHLFPASPGALWRIRNALMVFGTRETTRPTSEKEPGPSDYELRNA